MPHQQLFFEVVDCGSETQLQKRPAEQVGGNLNKIAWRVKG